MMAIIEWWCDLSLRGKYLFSGFWLAVSTAILIFAERVWFWGWAIGSVLLVCTFLKVGED